MIAERPSAVIKMQQAYEVAPKEKKAIPEYLRYRLDNVGRGRIAATV
jgi:hypothetical protein